MASRAGRDMTVEEFNAWSKARSNVSKTLEACAEEGGPRISLVPDPVSVPYEVVPDLVQLPVPVEQDASSPGPHAVSFTPEPSRKTGGWSAFRQRLFIETLAETGSVHVSSKLARLSARSAYALRVRSPTFAAAWDAALQLAVGRLSALAFDRAIHGRIEQFYRDGDLIGERRVPNDRLLMWLLARLDPKRFAAPWERRIDGISNPQAEAQRALPDLLDAITDVAQELPQE